MKTLNPNTITATATENNVTCAARIYGYGIVLISRATITAINDSDMFPTIM